MTLLTLSRRAVGSESEHRAAQVLIEKCLGRRLCSCCGKSFNVADINLPASATEPAIKMPPLNPPASCVPFLEMRSDDNYATIKRRLEVSCYRWARTLLCAACLL